jgi:hypothetical protein
MSNGAYGLNYTSGNALNDFNDWNAYYGNTSGARSSNQTAGLFDVALGADPFIDALGDNFRLNNVANGGALLKAMGFPSTFGGLTSTIGYPSIGAVEMEMPTDDDIAAAVWAYANRELT